MDKKVKAEAKRARRDQRKLEPSSGVNQSEEVRGGDMTTPETDPINSKESR